ncbi:NFU1 iron-sulfur cluster scaffold like, mitochondrial, partial [Pseudolycoriella hygida]
MGMSGFLLYLAQKNIPMGTAYAVWTGVGIVGTFLVGVLLYADHSSFVHYVGIMLIVSGITCLNVRKGCDIKVYVFIQTEVTPNPHAIKFFPNLSVSPEQPFHFNNAEEAKSCSSDFITITKEEQGDWLTLKPEILMTIMDYFTAGFPVFYYQQGKSSASDSEELSEIEQQIIEIIDSRVRPSVAMDGGDIIYRGFEKGIVKLELRGACLGCPSSTITLKNGIESMLKHFIPEVEAVEAIE